MLSRQIYLIGMPGSGKSTVGLRAARDTGVPFLDLDDWIEARAGMTIPEIFEKYGEEGFRRMETNALVYLTRSRPGVISLGGGTPMNPVNRKIMQSYGSVILIDRPLEKILEGLRTENRPLLSAICLTPKLFPQPGAPKTAMDRGCRFSPLSRWSY